MPFLDERQFIELFDRHSDAIFRYCIYRLEDKEKSRELTQETFLRAWKMVRDNKEVSYPKAMLYTVAKNLIIDYVRRKKEASLDNGSIGGATSAEVRASQIACTPAEERV